jgi:glycosyltransferase involved in cell wall biosynthesis
MVAIMKFSIVMATLNSMRTLEASLKAIRNQKYNQDFVEILLIDGGSNDGTREMALRYNCRIIDNPKVDPVNAKLIGLREATGDWLMHVDSDEVLVSPEALSKRARVFSENPGVKMVFSSGYVNPPDVPFAARYINEFGDPFSMFYYRLSKDHRFFLPQMCKQLEVRRDDADYVLFALGKGPQPILENAACGNCIDLKFFRTHFPELCDKLWGPVHFFYHMQRHTNLFAITKDDSILHYSADHWSGFLRKIKWRIRNNVFFTENMGASGFSGRIEFDSWSTRMRRYLYLPYTFLIFPMCLDTLFLMCTRRDFQYWQHIPLTLYTAGTIVLMMGLKILGYRPQLKSYGEQKTIPSTARPD